MKYTAICSWIRKNNQPDSQNNNIGFRVASTSQKDVYVALTPLSSERMFAANLAMKV